MNVLKQTIHIYIYMKPSGWVSRGTVPSSRIMPLPEDIIFPYDHQRTYRYVVRFWDFLINHLKASGFARNGLQEAQCLFANYICPFQKNSKVCDQRKFAIRFWHRLVRLRHHAFSQVIYATFHNIVPVFK